MKPYYQDNLRTIYCSDFRENDLPDESVQMVVTSPPYFGLRKYSGEQELIWGGDEDCEHEWYKVEPLRKHTPGDKPGPNSIIASRRTVNENRPGQISNTCSLCGAWKGQLGLEPTPEMYIEHTIEILREIKRVLRKDGVVFWNIGDSYAGSRGAHTFSHANPGLSKSALRGGVAKHGGEIARGPSKSGFRVKPKDLCLIPFRVAIAAQEDGWWVRSVIIWQKLNCMPESVRDRPTESHEYILMLTKSSRYYWDQEAVREKYTEPMNRWGGETLKRDTSKTAEYKEMQNIGYSSAFRVGRPMRPNPAGRNLRSVWEFPTTPFPGSHFAVFPEKLPEICIKAATPEMGCCSKCRAPWARITENKPMVIKRTDWGDKAGNRTASSGTMMEPNKFKTLGWQPTCSCNADKVPSLVLDSFAGSGTTGLVAAKLGRRCVMYDISEEYCDLNRERNKQMTLEFVNCWGNEVESDIEL